MIPVTILQDESSHWYIVPNSETSDFYRLNERIEDDYEDYNAINETFSKYRTGGDINNYQLFISEAELKSMTEDV